MPLSDDPYSLLKIEQIASQGLSTKFDGITANFAQFLQDASSQVSISVWHNAPFLTYQAHQYNIFHDFISIPQSVIESQAISRWTDPTKLANHSRKATTAFHIKLLCLFLLNSITTTFCTTIQNRAGTLLRNDGQSLLWLVCNHVYASKNAFDKTIRDSIRTRSLAKDHANNIESYVNWVRHQLRHIQPSETETTCNDLLDPIFDQLFLSGIECFTTSVHDWHEAHYHNDTPITPLLLLAKVDRRIQVLRSANMLLPKPDDSNLMALQATDISQPSYESPPVITPHQMSGPSYISHPNTELIAHYTVVSPSHRASYQQPLRHPAVTPMARYAEAPWKFQAPANLNEVRLYENKEWNWCPKCRHRTGMWVTSHKPWQHDELPRSHSPNSMQHQDSATRAKTPPPYHVLRPATPTPDRYGKRPYSPSPRQPTSPRAPKRTRFHAQVAVNEFITPLDDLVDYSAAQDSDDDAE